MVSGGSDDEVKVLHGPSSSSTKISIGPITRAHAKELKESLQTSIRVVQD